MDTCKCGHNRSQHARGFMGDVLLAEGRFMCGMCDCPCRDFEVIELTNNEQNKLLAALVGDHFHTWESYQVSALMNAWKCSCGANEWKRTNPDFFDPNIRHSKVVELVGKAVEKFGYQKVNTAFENAARRMGMQDGFTVTVEMMDAAAKASVIVNLIKEQDAK